MKRTFCVAEIRIKRFALLQSPFHTTICNEAYGPHHSEICRVGKRKNTLPMCHVKCRAMCMATNRTKTQLEHRVSLIYFK